jgi:tryptophan synthase alpha chain
MSDAPASSPTPGSLQGGEVGIASALTGSSERRSQRGDGAPGTGRGSAASEGGAVGRAPASPPAGGERPPAAVADPASGTDRICAAFEGAARAGRAAALMPYLMGGYPTLAQSTRIGEACVQAGADILELGVPYSDPLADGPVIHEAGTRALAAGASLAGVLEVARALAPRVPVVLMCYANIVMAGAGGAPIQAFVERLARTGACGLIVPDLPFEEAAEVLAACDAHGLALVPLVAPTTPPGRLAKIGARARGFLYTVSVVGTTGEREALSERYREVVARARAATAVPVALGFGISTPEQARRAADAGADGVIVGTRLVRAAGESEDPAGAVGALVAELGAALER